MIAVRLVHDDAALAQMRAAALATAEAHEAGARASRTARVESEIRAAMESAMARHRMGTASGPLVTVHGEVLHNERQDGAVAPGDLVLADVGAESWEGWACDVTRVWPSSGALSTTQPRIQGSVGVSATNDMVLSSTTFVTDASTSARVLGAASFVLPTL